MCEKYIIEPKSCVEMQAVMDELAHKFAPYAIHLGEATPTGQYPVYVAGDANKEITLMIWGLPAPTNNGVCIHMPASEVEAQLPKAFAHRRCVVISTGFVAERMENSPKQRKFFRAGIPHTPMLYMAGVFEEDTPYCRYVLLTSGEEEHLPLILQPLELDAWLRDERFARTCLEQAPPELEMTELFESESHGTTTP